MYKLFYITFNTSSIVIFVALISLFVTGHGDYLTCFYCGIGLRDWIPGDIPFEEHARWSPTCVYVHYIKCPYYIHETRRLARQDVIGVIYSVTLNE